MGSNILGSITTIADLGTVPVGTDLSEAILPVEAGRKTFKLTLSELATEIGGGGGDPDNKILFTLSVADGAEVPPEGIVGYGAVQSFTQFTGSLEEAVPLTVSNTTFDPEGVVELGEPSGPGTLLMQVSPGTTEMTVVHEYESVTYTQKRNLTVPAP